MNEIWKKTPLVVFEKILYYTYIAFCKDPRKDNDLDFYTKDASCEYKPLYIPEKSINFQDFSFLMNIDNGFVKVEPSSYDNFSQFLFYENVQLNFDKYKLRKIINKYILPYDKNKCVVMGGYFSKYHTTIISDNFPAMYNNIKKQCDVDIFMLYGDNDVLYVPRKSDENLVSSRYIYLPYDNEYVQKYTTMKFKTEECIVNLILVHKNEKYKENYSVLEVNKHFDFELSRILYSFKFDSIYVPASLFKQYRNILRKFSVNVNIKELVFYVNKIVKHELYEKKRPKVKVDKIDDHDFRVFLTRYLKYCFKGFFKNEEEARQHVTLIKNLWPFYNFFETYCFFI